MQQTIICSWMPNRISCCCGCSGRGWALQPGGLGDHFHVHAVIADLIEQPRRLAQDVIAALALIRFTSTLGPRFRGVAGFGCSSGCDWMIGSSVWVTKLRPHTVWMCDVISEMTSPEGPIILSRGGELAGKGRCFSNTLNRPVSRHYRPDPPHPHRGKSSARSRSHQPGQHHE